MKISVLVPVYNSADYLEYCLNSILAQTFSDFELIFLNDGSTDGSGTILERYKSRDSRIRIIHTENKGLSNARNVLVSEARGEYIAFVDSDDAIKPDYLQILYDTLTEHDSDIAVCNFYKYVDSEKMYYFHQIDTNDEYVEMDSYGYYQNMLLAKYHYNICLVTVWCKLFKKELFKNIWFPVGKAYEDSFSVYKITFNASKITYVNKALYMYRIREGSIIKSGTTPEKIKAWIEQCEERLALLTACGITVTRDEIQFYSFVLHESLKMCLDSGFIELYYFVKQKISFIDAMKQKKEV